MNTASNTAAMDHDPCFSDRDYVLSAVMEWGPVLERASPELRADATVVRAAVDESGYAMAFASPELKADRGFFQPVVEALCHPTGALAKRDKHAFEAEAWCERPMRRFVARAR